MRTIYIDNDYKCHVNDSGSMTSVETDAFDGKCDAYIEGYRLVPEGRAWTREDGMVFHGEMIAPWKPYGELAAAQAEYEKAQAEVADMQAALELLGVTVDE